MKKAGNVMILEQIVAAKEADLKRRRNTTPVDVLERQLLRLPPTRGFTNSLRKSSPAVIAEIKKASPSKGVIRENFDPVEIAKSYEQAQAAALSVLTDKPFFQGSDEYLLSVKEATGLPILRKDFILDRYQVIETRCLGADCLLLIASMLNSAQLQELYSLALDLSLDVLIEVHDLSELRMGLNLNPEPSLIGINNRDLHTFETNLLTTEKLAKEIPESTLVISESGIHTREDIERLQNANVDAFLVGEAFMRAEDPGQLLTELFGPIRRS